MDTILAQGAEGAVVAKFSALARAAGLEIPQYTDNEPLQAQVVDEILTGLTLGDPAERTAPADAVYAGRVIDQRVWDELRARAEQMTGLTAPAGAPAPQFPPAPPADAAAAAQGGASA